MFIRALSYYSFIFCFGMYVLWDKPWQLWDIKECYYKPLHNVWIMNTNMYLVQPKACKPILMLRAKAERIFPIETLSLIVNIGKSYGPIWKFSTPLHSGERYLPRSTQQHNFQSLFFSCKIIILKAQKSMA